MRTLKHHEALKVSGGNILEDLKNVVSTDLSHEMKTLLITSLSAGLVAGRFIPFTAWLGIGGFAAWIAYDMTGDNFSIPFYSESSVTTETT